MGWIDLSQPPEADDPPPTRLQQLAWERAALLAKVRPRVRSLRQERIRERIAGLTRLILSLAIGDAR